ncbi:efflux RND transporter periplasmic adaptor subunit [Parvibium lacunae]|uniref:HlyD family secretion protein n=1 Tax=Parvibium lacunae TaxID=1888893 RepID=A0A368L1X9_9BURK|nr:efflux RND transporter periplasmic adaptor subunit [Parvibium lacunae]RCS57390.1 HlyD family secretion protein [Parvibium lacunae]
MPKKRLLLVGIVLLCGLAGAGGYVWLRQPAPEAQYKLARIERGALSAIVAASGTLNPVAQVQVGTQVSGQLKEVLADFNSEVKQGQIIARLDPETYELKVRQAQADLEAAQAQLLTQQANVLAQQAEVGRVKASLLDAQRDYERKETLVKQNFISPAERDKAFALYQGTQEQLKTADAQLTVARAQVRQAEASLSQRRAALASAQVDLGRTVIRSPVDGIVVKRSIEPGQTVAASLQAPELFIIARNLHDMQVETAIDEADVGRVRAGQTATFTVDAFPGKTFEGSVRQIRKAALNVQNVITYTVVIATSNPQQTLLPGMTANVRIVTDTRSDVLKLPNSALRYRPPATESGKGKSDTNDKKSGGNAADRAGPASGQDRSQAMREQLTQTLQLSASQQAQLDPIFTKLREKMQTVRTLPDAERGKASEQARAEMRASIRALLTPPQQQRYDEYLASQSGRASSRGRVYQLQAGQPTLVNLSLGITDGTYTEVLGKTLKEGDEVIVGQAKNEAKTAPRSPF